MKLAFKIQFIRLSIFGVIFLFAVNNYAQQYNFKNYSVESGLPYVQIFAMFQDSKGYLWSGGYGGASKFNGKTFQNYSPKNGLANHYVNAIIEDQFHLVTIGTIDGISVIDKAPRENKQLHNKRWTPFQSCD
jgi:ligand-binding sensor domain-containing protein